MWTAATPRKGDPTPQQRPKTRTEATRAWGQPRLLLAGAKLISEHYLWQATLPQLCLSHRLAGLAVFAKSLMQPARQSIPPRGLIRELKTAAIVKLPIAKSIWQISLFGLNLVAVWSGREWKVGDGEL